MSGHLPPLATHRRSATPRYPLLLAVLVGLSLLGLGLVLVGRYGPATAAGPGPSHRPGHDPSRAVPTTPPPAPSATRIPGPTPGPITAGVVTALHVPFPRSGPETFRYAATAGPVLGSAGPIRRFRVAIESNIGVVRLAAFTAKINETLGDRRSWIAGDRYRLQQVAGDSPAQFTVYLVTEATSSRMCAPLYTGGYTSCRQGSHVVLNLDRWMTSVPGYVDVHIALETYRTYMINHEVGHALGHGHELCPSHRALAPVMEQQTLGLHGCLANPWPYVHGRPYDGPLGQY